MEEPGALTLGMQVSCGVYSGGSPQSALGEIRESLGAIFPELARQKECRLVEGHLLPDHVHMCIEIPPKYAVAPVIGFLKGKSSLAIARQLGGS